LLSYLHPAGRIKFLRQQNGPRIYRADLNQLIEGVVRVEVALILSATPIGIERKWKASRSLANARQSGDLLGRAERIAVRNGDSSIDDPFRSTRIAAI